VASQARRGSFQGALRVAYRSGTIAGMLADGLGLLGGTTIFMLFGRHAPEVLLGFGFGGTLLAMFMRVGAASTPRQRTWAPTWSVKWKPTCRGRSPQRGGDR